MPLDSPDWVRQTIFETQTGTSGTANLTHIDLIKQLYANEDLIPVMADGDYPINVLVDVDDYIFILQHINVKWTNMSPTLVEVYYPGALGGSEYLIEEQPAAWRTRTIWTGNLLCHRESYIGAKLWGCIAPGAIYLGFNGYIINREG